MKTYKWLIFFLILFSGELSAQGFVVDHTCIDENDTVIPMEYLNAARQLDITFGHNSIGGDVTHGMEFLRDQVNSSRYDLTIIESYHSGDGIDLPAPEWFDSNSGIVGWRVLSNDNPWDKRDNFSDHIALYGSRVDVAMMKYGHLDQNDGESPTQLFERLRDDIEDLESDYPNVVFVWWTMPVTAASYCGSSNQTRYEYNTLVRQYVSEHNKVLLDIADIEGHAPDGSPVYDGDCDVMYPEYAQEDNVHLRPHDETSGAPRLARAMWWLMARLAGWDPDGGGETLTLDWPDPPNAYSWDGSWSPSASQLPPDGLFDDVYYDGHLVDGEPSPILPQGDWDWVNPNNGDVSELANWNGFESGTGHFDPLLDSQGNQFGWRLIGNSSDIEMTSTSYKGSDGVDIVDYGENGSIHSTASIRFQDGPDMIRYTQSWSIGWRVGSDIDGYDNDNDLVIAGYDAIQSPGEFPIQTSGVHTGPGNDLVFMKDMTRSMVDLGNGNDGSTDSIDQHDGDDIIVADGNWLDNRVMGGGGDDIFFWYVDNNRPDNSWTGGRFLGTGSFGDAIWGDDTDRFVLIIPDDTEVVNGHGSLDPGTIQIWQQDPYPADTIDPPTANDPMARYHSYHTGPGGRRMVTFNYKRITDDYYTGYMNMASIEELQIGVGPNAKVYDIDDVNGTATYNPSLAPISEDEIPSREDYNILMDSFAPTPPIPDFEADLTNISNCGGDLRTVSFTDLTTSSPESWQWSFSPSDVTYVDNTNENSQNPKVQFLSEGSYTVSLTASNGFGAITVSKSNYITVTLGSSVPFSEDFESFTLPQIPGDLPTWGPYEWELSAGWENLVNDDDDDTDWIPWQGGTDTNYTGPSGDYNTGNGVYLYMEASGSGNRNNDAIVVSPCIDLTNVTNPQLSFAYHRYGSDLERLRCDIFSNGNWENIFQSQSGSQGDQWSLETIDLSEYEGETVKLRFRANTGGGSQADTAIDAISITGEVGPTPGNIQFSSATYSVSEAGGSVSISATRTSGSQGSAHVSYATSDGSATSGSDYTQTSGTLSWTNGVSGSQSFDVPILNDSAVEGNETINLTLSNFVGADDAGSPTSAIVTIQDDDGGGQTEILNLRINTGSDDAEEAESGGVYLTSSDLELVEDESSGSQTVGMRFTGVTVPQGATVTNAYVQFEVDETTSTSTSLEVRGNDVNNASTFVNSNGNISGRTVTDALVNWNPPAWNQEDANGEDQRTPDISSIIQEIVDRSGWNSGNAIALIITGSGERVAKAYELNPNGPDVAPELHIEYYEGTAANTAPVVSDILDQTIAEGSNFAQIPLDDYVTDDEDSDSQIQWDFSGNTDLQVAIANRVATITTPDENWNGSETVTFTATDTGGLSDNDAATFTVVAGANQAPVVSDIPNQTIAEGSNFAQIQLDDYVTDDEDSDSQIQWSFSGNTNLQVTIANRVATITTSDENWNGSETVTFTATDTGGLSDNDAATFTITGINDAPVVSDILDQTIPEGIDFFQIQLDNYVTDDEDADSQIQWSFTGNTDLQVTIANRVATITTPDENWNGSETVTFTATDTGGLTGSDAAVFTITGINDAPVVSDIPDQTIAEGADFSQIQLDNYVTDDEDSDSQIQWSFTGNTDLQVTIANRVATITTPDENWNGSETVNFTATDTGGMTNNDAATFTITTGNDAPVVSDIPNQSIDEGGTFTQILLDNYVTDDEDSGSQIQWSFTGNTDLQVTINNRVVTVVAPDGDWSGAETVTFIATDTGGLSGQNDAIFIINSVNDAPVVSDIPNQTIEEGGNFAQIQLDQYVTDIEDADSQIGWVYTGNTDLLVTINNRVATITTPDENWNGSETITFIATDVGGLFDTGRVDFTVNPVNDAPVLTNIPDQMTLEGTAFSQITLDTYVTDIEDADNLIVWSFTGNINLQVTITNRIAVVSPLNENWHGSETITFIATDTGGLSNNDSATFTVATGANQAPVVSNIPNQTIAEGDNFAQIPLDDYVTDEDIDSQIQWGFTGNTDLQVTINSRIAVVSPLNENWNGSETITFTATDTGNMFSSNQAIFTINPVNDAPVVTDIPSQTVDQGNNFSQIQLDNYVTDVEDSDSGITWTCEENGDLLVVINDRVATITTPDGSWEGSETVTFRATDTGDLFASDQATFTVNAANNPPRVFNIPGQTVDEGGTFTSIPLDNYVRDTEDQPHQIQWSYTGHNELTVTIDANRIALVSAPSESWNGSEYINFIATDTDGLTDRDAAAFVVNPVNDPPVVSDIPSEIIEIGDGFPQISLNDYVSDPDDEDSQIQWSVTGNTYLDVAITDQVATINPPNALWTGSELITFIATDTGGLFDSDQAVFTAYFQNDPPQVSDIPDQTVVEGSTFTPIQLDLYVTDEEDSEERMNWTFYGNTDLQIVIDEDRIVTIFSPHTEWNGTEIVTFITTDTGGLSDNTDVAFTVTPVNDAPAWTDIPSVAFSMGDSFSLNLIPYAQDPDDEIYDLLFNFDPLDAVNLEIQELNRQNGIFTVRVRNIPWVGSETITFSVADPEGEIDFYDVDFIVTRKSGDIIADGAVDGLDIDALMDDILSPTDQLVGDEFDAADLDGDNQLTISDLIILFDIALAQIK